MTPYPAAPVHHAEPRPGGNGFTLAVSPDHGSVRAPELRDPVHPASTEQQPAGATGAAGAAVVAVASVAAVAEERLDESALGDCPDVAAVAAGGRSDALAGVAAVPA